MKIKEKVKNPAMKKQYVSFNKQRKYDNYWSESYTCITDGTIINFLAEWSLKFGGRVLQTTFDDFKPCLIVVEYNPNFIYFVQKISKVCKEHIDNIEFWEE